MQVLIAQADRLRRIQHPARSFFKVFHAATGSWAYRPCSRSDASALPRRHQGVSPRTTGKEETEAHAGLMYHKGAPLTVSELAEL